ncbi:MAG: hypothetical protein WCL39_09345, partial [Armatimonadota bacterium]
MGRVGVGVIGICALLVAGQIVGAEGAKRLRVWDNTIEDGGAIHAMGNGKTVVYSRGPEITQFFGPPYSSPPILTLSVESSGHLIDTAERDTGTAVWSHRMTIDGQPCMQFTETTTANDAAYIRSFVCTQGDVKWVIHPAENGGFRACHSPEKTFLQTVKPGNHVFNYPTSLWSHHWIVLTGSCSGETREDGALVVSIKPGTGALLIVGATELGPGVETTEKLMELNPKSLVDQARKEWQTFTRHRMKSFKPGKTTAQALEVLDSAAVLIKSQQAESGGEMAGPYFPLAYIRDQYGVSRGMLATGMLDEAKLNLEFRWRKYQTFGSLKTAEAMGVDCMRHVHENDDVEGPAYTILQARDYIARSGDNAFGRTIWQMLKWCWNTQQKNVKNGLLPFNGDETYVAGGFYPRSGLLQGSADTTLVYAESGKWLAEWAVKQKLWSEAYSAEQRVKSDEAFVAYRKSFFDRNRVWANEPKRDVPEIAPRFRHGVCEGLCGWFGWTERTENARYLCPVC